MRSRAGRSAPPAYSERRLPVRDLPAQAVVTALELYPRQAQVRPCSDSPASLAPGVSCRPRIATSARSPSLATLTPAATASAAPFTCGSSPWPPAGPPPMARPRRACGRSFRWHDWSSASDGPPGPPCTLSIPCTSSVSTPWPMIPRWGRYSQDGGCIQRALTAVAAISPWRKDRSSAHPRPRLPRDSSSSPPRSGPSSACAWASRGRNSM